jgi:subtilase family serine protease
MKTAHLLGVALALAFAPVADGVLLGKPDFAANLARSTGPRVAKPGQTWDYFVRITNRGNIRYTGYVDVALVTRGPRRATSTTWVYLDLPPLTGREVRLGYSVPALAVKGTYTVQAVIDPYDYVDERIETNNTAALGKYNVK